jgi:hypothetical protein
VEVGDTRRWDGFAQTEADVGSDWKKGLAAAEQDRHLMQDHLVYEVRFQRGGQHAAHEDVLVAGGGPRGRDRVLDAGGDERLRLAELRRGPVAEDAESRRRARATASPMTGVLVLGGVDLPGLLSATDNSTLPAYLLTAVGVGLLLAALLTPNCIRCGSSPSPPARSSPSPAAPPSTA